MCSPNGSDDTDRNWQIIMYRLQMSPVMLVGIIVCGPNCSDATDVFVRETIFGMSHGLTNTALALPPFITDECSGMRRSQCKKTSLA